MDFFTRCNLCQILTSINNAVLAVVLSTGYNNVSIGFILCQMFTAYDITIITDTKQYYSEIYGTKLKTHLLNNVFKQTKREVI